MGYGQSADQLSLDVFVATGLVIARLNRRLHLAEAAQRASAATATARAERLDAVLNITVDGVIVIDAQGRIEGFNRGAQELFGYPESEVLGRNVSILMPSPHHEQHDSYQERYLATGEAKIIGIGREVPGRRRDGTSFPVHLSVGEMRIRGQRKFTGMLRDLTKRVHLEGELGASEARWRAVVDSARAGEDHRRGSGSEGPPAGWLDVPAAFDSGCQLAFIDGGPGIPADVRDKIFTPFFTPTKARGTGLGLPTAKRIIQAHNGQITIDCPPAGGTRVVIRLPLATA